MRLEASFNLFCFFVIGQKPVKNHKLCLLNTVILPEKIQTNPTFGLKCLTEAVATVFITASLKEA